MHEPSTRRASRMFFALVLVVPAFGGLFTACGGSVGEQAGGTDTDTGGTDVSLVETATDGSPTTDTGTASDSTKPPPADSGIKCGSDTCDAASQECCAGTSGLKCVAKGGCGGGTVIPCSDPSSCPSGEVCCATRDGFALKVSCAATCASGFSLCTSDKDCTAPETCATGLLGYKYCSGRDGGTGFDTSGFFDAPKG